MGNTFDGKVYIDGEIIIPDQKGLCSAFEFWEKLKVFDEQIYNFLLIAEKFIISWFTKNPCAFAKEESKRNDAVASNRAEKAIFDLKDTEQLEHTFDVLTVLR